MDWIETANTLHPQSQKQRDAAKCISIELWGCIWVHLKEPVWDQVRNEVWEDVIFEMKEQCRENKTNS